MNQEVSKFAVRMLWKSHGYFHPWKLTIITGTFSTAAPSTNVPATRRALFGQLTPVWLWPASTMIGKCHR